LKADLSKIWKERRDEVRRNAKKTLKSKRYLAEQDTCCKNYKISRAQLLN